MKQTPFLDILDTCMCFGELPKLALYQWASSTVWVNSVSLRPKKGHSKVAKNGNF